jgi:P27 family predicted phage terminase small subunit
MPDVPGNLTSAAYREWHRFAAILRGMGVLTEADGPSLGRLAESHARVIELTDLINKRGFFYDVTTKAGVESKVRPEVKLLRSEERHFVSLCREFGLTPSSRMLLRISYEGVATDEVEDKYFPQ